MLKGANLMWSWKKNPEVERAVVRLSLTGPGEGDLSLCTPQEVKRGGHCLPIPIPLEVHTHLAQAACIGLEAAQAVTELLRSEKISQIIEPNPALPTPP